LTHPLPQFRRDRWLELDRWHDGRCTFRIPDEWDVRTLIRFGAVDWRATVFLDGELLGTHEGGYTHFTFDAGRLAPASEHELVLEVFDPDDDWFGQPKGKQRGSHGIWYTRTTGIWRPVWIEAVPEDYLREVVVDASPDGGVRLNGTTVAQIDEPRLWSPDDPFLYDVELRHGDDVVHSYVGFRTIERRGRALYLNGEPLRVAGVLDQGYWPETGYSATDEQLRADVEAARALGFNLARKHVKVEDPRWYAWCDRLGLLVAQDMPSSHDLSSDEARVRFEREWLEIVAQLRAHPSVVLWIPFNENWGDPPPDFQRGLVRATRAADPTRLVIDASGWNQLEDTDLVDVHDYGAALTGHLGARDDLPLWFGELGGVSLGTRAGNVGGQAADAQPKEPAAFGGAGEFAYRHVDDLAAAYRSLVEQIPDEVAGFVWTQLADVEQEQNGLLTAGRRPKTDPEAIRRVNEAFLRA
jgi:beta-galactosidase/beta-glucuronidase